MSTYVLKSITSITINNYSSLFTVQLCPPPVIFNWSLNKHNHRSHVTALQLTPHCKALPTHTATKLPWTKSQTSP